MSGKRRRRLNRQQVHAKKVAARVENEEHNSGQIPPPRNGIGISDGRRQINWNEQKEQKETAQRLSLIFEGVIAFAALIGVPLLAVELCQSRESFEATIARMDESNKIARESSKESLRLAREELTDARKAFESAQRALMGATAVKYFKIRATDSIERVRVEVRNTGESTATNVDMHAIAVLRDGVLERCAKLPQWKDADAVSRASVIPDAYGYIEVDIHPITPEIAKRLFAGTLSLYIYGRVRYNDGFDPNRETGFCFFHSRDTDDWIACMNNNWFDEAKECEEDSGKLGAASGRPAGR